MLSRTFSFSSSTAWSAMMARDPPGLVAPSHSDDPLNPTRAQRRPTTLAPCAHPPTGTEAQRLHQHHAREEPVLEFIRHTLRACRVSKPCSPLAPEEGEGRHPARPPGQRGRAAPAAPLAHRGAELTQVGNAFHFRRPFGRKHPLKRSPVKESLADCYRARSRQ